MFGTTKEITVLAKQAIRQGWTITKTNGGHLRWTSPSGSFFFSALTPSDPRTIKNLQRDLRVNGFVVLERKKGRR
jgi:hypothetical protein